MGTVNEPRSFVTLGMFIIDEFLFMGEDGRPTGRTMAPQGSWLPPIGGGGTYAAVGARIWLPPSRIGMVVDKGSDFPQAIEKNLLEYGEDMWMFREQPDRETTRALNSYRGEQRGFEYKTPRTRITPKDLVGTRLAKPKILHFICSPSRAWSIISEVKDGWKPITVYEPIPDRCIPEELPALRKVLPFISILSPNAEEALSFLSHPLPASKETIEQAASQFHDMGVGNDGDGWVVIRSGPLGAYVKSRKISGSWVEAFWTGENAEKVVDVTGAGNSFLGGFGAGMILSSNDVYEATLYATVAASFVIEQEGLPRLSQNLTETWNGDEPRKRLQELKRRHGVNND